MYPSHSRMAASDSFSFEPGIDTVSNWAELAFLMRVSMSAIGSVIVMAAPLPTRLRHAGNLAGVHHRPQADTAQSELAVDRARAATLPAPGVAPHFELGNTL